MTGNIEGENQRFTPTDWDWVMFMSGEINAIETRFDIVWTTAIAISCVFIGFLIGFMGLLIGFMGFQMKDLGYSDLILDSTSSIIVNLAAAIFVSLCCIFLIYRKKEREAKKMVKRLKKCREELFSKLNAPNKILECYLNAVGKKGDKNK
jgi:F0F1-type ATP synthase membrane subunit a